MSPCLSQTCQIADVTATSLHGPLGDKAAQRNQSHIKVARGVRALRGRTPEPPNPKEETMVRAYITSAVAGAFLLGMATAALAVTGEYDNMCTMGLALGKDVQTDCSVNSRFKASPIVSAANLP